MALRAKVHKSGFKAWLHAGHLGFVDTRLFLLSGSVFNIEIIEFLTVNQGNPNFLGLGSVNEHSFHISS